MTRCPSWEPPTPTPSDTSGAGGADRQGEGSKVGPGPQLHTKPFTFSSLSKLLPGLRCSEGLGCPLRWSAGRSDSLSALPPPSHLSLLLPAPRHRSQWELSQGLGATRAPRVPGAPASQGSRQRSSLRGTTSPSRSATGSGAHAHSHSGRIRSASVPSPGSGVAQPQARSYLSGGGAARSERTELPARAPRRGAAALVLRRWQLQRPLAGWLADWLAARLTPHWGFL